MAENDETPPWGKKCCQWGSGASWYFSISNGTDYALSELVKYVMEDTGCSIEEAMEMVYDSPLMAALQDEEGELYVQSPAYLYELMGP